MIRERLKCFVEIEDAARRFYRAAAERFTDDKELQELLLTLEADEHRHYAIIKALQGFEEELPAIELTFSMAEHEMAETLEKFHNCRERLKDGTLTKIDLLHAIAEVEFAEHNDFFLYTVNSIKEALPGIISKVIDFKEHRAHIERFLKTRPEFNEVIDKINLLPVVSKGRLLIVDDETALIEAFNKLLSEHGIIDSASNGEEALAKLNTHEYAAIITDVMMPVMDGIEFYQKAIALHPHTKNRFIFLTNFGDMYSSFFKENTIKYLEKPASIKEIKKALSEVLHH